MSIRLENVTFAYPDSGNVIENINLEIKDGEFVAIIGQNGAGKSTILKCIAGLLKPKAGKIVINGEDTANMSIAAISKQIALVLQNPDRQLFTNSVYDEIAYGLNYERLDKQEVRGRVEQALRLAKLENMADEFPLALPKCDRSRIVIACAIAQRAKTIMLDEPTGGQDYKGSRQIMELLKTLHKDGKTIALVTHNMQLVCEYVTRVVVLDNKSVFMDGAVREVFGETGKLEAAAISQPQITKLACMLAGVMPIEQTMLTPKELGDTLLALKRTK